MMKYTFLLGALLAALVSQAQTGLSAGYSVIRGFNSATENAFYNGIHVGVELPRDDEMSFFGRLTATLPHVTRDSATAVSLYPGVVFPDVKYVGVEQRHSYINIEGGNRYYLGNGYDYGWSAYGGTLLGLSVQPVSYRPDDLDPNYGFQDSQGQRLAEKGAIITVNFGLNAGVKKHFHFGMLYLDFSLSYSLLAVGSNSMANDLNYTNFAPLLIGASVGYRKDLY
jgi:hypothetical protein